LAELQRLLRIWFFGPRRRWAFKRIAKDGTIAVFKYRIRDQNRCMPRRELLTAAQREALLAFPDEEENLLQHYVLSVRDLAAARQHRGDHNRLGFAVQLCYLRYPGRVLAENETPPAAVLGMVAAQLQVQSALWDEYAQRDETRREHLIELQHLYGFQPFTSQKYREFAQGLIPLADRTHQAMVLARCVIEQLRSEQVIIPPLSVIERLCAEAITRAERRLYRKLTSGLDESHRTALDNVLGSRLNTKQSTLAWLRQSPGAANPRNIVEHIERLKAIRSVALPQEFARNVHQNHLLRLARQGAQTPANDFRDLTNERRYATLVAVLLETSATITDEILELNDRLLGSLFAKAKRQFESAFQDAGRAINNKVRLYAKIGQALIEAKTSLSDPFLAIESIVPWERFIETVAEAEQLAQSEDFDYLGFLGDSSLSCGATYRRCWKLLTSRLRRRRKTCSMLCRPCVSGIRMAVAMSPIVRPEPSSGAAGCLMSLANTALTGTTMSCAQYQNYVIRFGRVMYGFPDRGSSRTSKII
jgi:hypothetical protein